MSIHEHDGNAVPSTTSADIDQLARQVSQHLDYRVLTRVAAPYASGATELPNGGRRLAIIDCETTGLDRRCDTIIEFAVMIAIVDADGRIVAHEKPVAWLEDAKFGLDPKVVRVTGITEEMIAGQRIDRDAAAAMLAGADLIIAHNAAFDRAFVERLLPVITDKGWACSCREVAWDELGCDGRALSWLLAQHGFFNSAHRAAADVWALFTLLQQPIDLDGGSVMQLLLEAADRATYRVEATGSRFTDKEQLKKWGYNWDPAREVWHITVEKANVADQFDLLALIGVTCPTVQEQTARDRHR